MCKDKKNTNKLFGVRAILSMFFAFWVIVVGTHLAPSILEYTKGWGITYCLSIVLSAVFIILNGVGFFDRLK